MRGALPPSGSPLLVDRSRRRTWQAGRGEAIEVGEAVAERAARDAQHIGWVAGVAALAGEAHVGSGPSLDAAVAPARERVGAGAGTEAPIRAALEARHEGLLPAPVEEKRAPSPGRRPYRMDGTRGTGGVREPSPTYGPAQPSA